MPITLDQAIDTVMELPVDEREMLVDILHSRAIAERRREIAEHAKTTLADFRAGLFRAQSADEVIAELSHATDEQ